MKDFSGSASGYLDYKDAMQKEIVDKILSSSESTLTIDFKFTYIWIPVGLLICLTVIAFNFVGDGAINVKQVL